MSPVVVVDDENEVSVVENDVSAANMAAYIAVGTILGMCVVIMCVKMIALGQKSRETQPNRMYVGSRSRQSLGHQPPTIYVSPANLPPPPKYEAMAPPSYDEVVNMSYSHYPPVSQSAAGQPITHPLTHAVAQSSSAPANHVAASNDTTRSADNEPITVVIAMDPSRTSVAVASS